MRRNVNALMFRMTSGMGWEPMKPSELLLVMLPPRRATADRRLHRNDFRRPTRSAWSCSQWRARSARWKFFATLSVDSMKPNEVVKINELRAVSQADDPLGVGAFGHALDIGGFDLRAECLLSSAWRPRSC